MQSYLDFEYCPGRGIEPEPETEMDSGEVEIASVIIPRGQLNSEEKEHGASNLHFLPCDAPKILLGMTAQTLSESSTNWLTTLADVEK